MRLSLVLLLLMVAGCAPAPPPPVAAQPQKDQTQEAWYGETVAQLTAANRRARSLLQRGKADEAAALITAGESQAARLLSVPLPTLAATEAASDLDDLYGRMLLANHNYGWARMMFQKNVVRWKAWKPQTGETARRLQAAEAALAECDRRLAQ